MAPFAMVFGILLVSLGCAGYFAPEMFPGGEPGTKSITALIPAFVGGPLFLLGVLALKENLRKHAMHAAATLGLLGFLGASVQFLRKALGDSFAWGPGTISQAIMAGLCGMFVLLCIKSFIDVRRARERANHPAV